MFRFDRRWGYLRPVLDPWDTVDDLRKWTHHRCAPAQFDAAVVVMGDDAYSVASYLCRHGYIALDLPQDIRDEATMPATPPCQVSTDFGSSRSLSLLTTP